MLKEIYSTCSGTSGILMECREALGGVFHAFCEEVFLAGSRVPGGYNEHEAIVLGNHGDVGHGLQRRG